LARLLKSDQFPPPGCVSPLPTGVLTDFGAAWRELGGRVHWAGTETSEVWCGYMDGAGRSAGRGGGWESPISGHRRQRPALLAGQPNMPGGGVKEPPPACLQEQPWKNRRGKAAPLCRPSRARNRPCSLRGKSADVRRSKPPNQPVHLL